MAKNNDGSAKMDQKTVDRAAKGLSDHAKTNDPRHPVANPPGKK